MKLMQYSILLAMGYPDTLKLSPIAHPCGPHNNSPLIEMQTVVLYLHKRVQVLMTACSQHSNLRNKAANV